MSIVQVGQGALRHPGDEGQALQRRLLQDLERQWLDSWQVAGQAQQLAPQARPEEKCPESQPAGLEDLSRTSSATPQAIIPGSAAPREVPAPSSVQGSVRPFAGSERMSPVRASEANVSRPVSQAGVSPGALPKGASAVRPESFSSTSAVIGSQANAEAAEAVAAARSAASLAVAGQPQSAEGGQPMREGREETRGLGGVQAAQAIANGASPFSDLLAHPAISRDSTVPPVLEHVVSSSTTVSQDALKPGLAAKLDSAAQAPTAATATETRPEADAASEERAARRKPQPRSEPAAAPGPRRLTLRELSEHEVLASMRDIDFTPHQSQLAAQGLARALMEAGYARVQVVVNGQQPMVAARSVGHAGPHESSSSSTPDTSSQEPRHGH